MLRSVNWSNVRLSVLVVSKALQIVNAKLFQVNYLVHAVLVFTHFVYSRCVISVLFVCQSCFNCKITKNVEEIWCCWSIPKLYWRFRCERNLKIEIYQI